MIAASLSNPDPRELTDKCASTSPTRAFSAAFAFLTTPGGVARIARVTHRAGEPGRGPEEKVGLERRFEQEPVL